MTGIKGMNVVNANLQRELKKIEGRSMLGLLDAANYIHNQTEKVSPKVPVGRTGNLHNSWRVTRVWVSWEPYVIIGYTAGYAVFVHEMVDSKVNWSRDGSGAKWLEVHLNRNTKTILKIIANKARIR